MYLYEDKLYGKIEIDPILELIIQSDEFKRLKSIKQTENINYLYPHAVHTRYEHCIGTSHLAKKLLDNLSSKHTELNITRKESLCVQIAALCHDIGHGPFSHLFELAVNSNSNSSFNHEDASLLIFELIFEKLKHEKVFQEANIFTEKDKNLIIELIHPKNVKKIYFDFINTIDKRTELGNVFIQRLSIPIERIFLFEIVSNFITDIDVDKWDYITRDAFYMDLKINFNYENFIHNCHINKLNGLFRLCFNDSAQIIDLINAKRSIQMYRYTVPNAIALRQMMIECLQEIVTNDEFIKKLQKNFDLDWYIKLTDNIIDKIETKDGKDILSRMGNGKYYHFITRLTTHKSVDCSIIKAKIASCLDVDETKLFVSLERYFFGKKTNLMIENFAQMGIESIHEIEDSLRELTTISLFYKPTFLEESVRNQLKEIFEKIVFVFNQSLESKSSDINANYVPFKN